MFIGLAEIASICVFGVAWMALQPGTSQIVGRADEDAAVLSKAPADALAPLPSSYEQVPKLGRPLPGDLGRPILRRQQQSGLAAAAGAPQSMIDQAAAEQREQPAEEQRAAREQAIPALPAAEEMSVANPSNRMETTVPAIKGVRPAHEPI